eukprot:g2700.t1
MQPDRFHQKTPGDVLRIDRYNEIMRNKKSAPMPPYGMNWRDTDRWEKQQEKQRKMQLESFANHGETSGEGGGLLALEDGAAPGTSYSMRSASQSSRSIKMRGTDESFEPHIPRKPIWYVKPNPGRQVILRDDILPLKRKTKSKSRKSGGADQQAEAKTARLLRTETNLNDLVHAIDNADPQTAAEIGEKEKKYLLQGTSFANLQEKEKYIKNSDEFDARLKSLLTKRERDAARVASRFDGDLNATTDRWGLKAPALDIQSANAIAGSAGAVSALQTGARSGTSSVSASRQQSKLQLVSKTGSAIGSQAHSQASAAQAPQMVPQYTVATPNVAVATPAPAVFLPKTVVVGAPTGCSTIRGQETQTATGEPLQRWQEKCYQLNAPNLEITDAKTGQLVSQAWTRPTGYTNIVDLTDCNGNTVYTVHEMVYRLSGGEAEEAGTSLLGSASSSLLSSTGTTAAGTAMETVRASQNIYLKYEIIAKSGTVVAVTPYVPLFAQSFKLLEPSNGRTIATLGKNGAWSPATACPPYEKKWYISYESATAAGSQDAGLTTEDKRWVVAAFMTVVAVRDQDRNDDGGVRWSTCTKRSIVVFVVLLVLIIGFFALLISLWIGLRMRETLIRFFFRLQEKVLPRAMHKMR